MTKKRYYWLDILKIVACYLIVVNHTGGYIVEFMGKDSLGANLFFSIQFVICKIGVPIFIMTTGYLLLTKNYNFKDVLKKIYRISVPLILFSIFIYWSWYGIGFNRIDKFIITFIKEPLIIPYWYLYMLIGLYLVTPFVQKMIKNFKMNDFRNFIIICVLIPATLPIFSLYFNFSFNEYFVAAIFPIYIGYYVAGIYLSKLELTKKNRNIALILFTVSLVLFFLSMFVPYMINNKLDLRLDSCAFITTALPALSFFYLIRYYFENRKFKAKTAKILTELSLVSFGIYLIHMFINKRLYYMTFIQNIFEFNSYIGIVTIQLLTFVIAGLFIYILRKIPIIKKFL